MRIRFKFTKTGMVKFVGHLDTVRLFQRAIKVAKLPIAYSQGFNPHSLVYFALPLSVGVGSTGEYMEMITTVDIEVEEAKEKLNRILPTGIKILTADVIDPKSTSLMSLVDGADYLITFSDKSLTDEDLKKCEERLQGEQLLIMKKGKKKTAEVDIKPLIYSFEVQREENNILCYVTAAAGSKQNLGMDLLMKALFEKDSSELECSIERQELYYLEGETLTPLSDCFIEHE